MQGGKTKNNPLVQLSLTLKQAILFWPKFAFYNIKLMEFHVFCPNIYVPTKILELLSHLKLLFVIVYIDDAVSQQVIYSVVSTTWASSSNGTDCGNCPIFIFLYLSLITNTRIQTKSKMCFFANFDSCKDVTKMFIYQK